MAINIRKDEIKDWATMIVDADRIESARLVAAAMDPDTGGAKTFDSGPCGDPVTHYVSHVPILKNMDVSELQKAYPDTLRIYLDSDGWSEKKALKQHGIGRTQNGNKYT